VKHKWTIVDGPADPSQITQGGSVVFSVTDDAGRAGFLEVRGFHANRHFMLRHHWNIVGYIIVDGESHGVVGTYKANHKHRNGTIHQI
jgi:hypothetical protein